jgi:T-complex protein 1 subunit epsilon
MSLAFDEYGRPYIIIKEQSQKKRIKGIEAYKVSIKITKIPNKISIVCIPTLIYINPLSLI